jgi:ribosomal protein L31E
MCIGKSGWNGDVIDGVVFGIAVGIATFIALGVPLREIQTASTSERAATAHRSVDLAWSFNFCFDHCILLAQATSSKLWKRLQKPTVETHERHPETPAIVR